MIRNEDLSGNSEFRFTRSSSILIISKRGSPPKANVQALKPFVRAISCLEKNNGLIAGDIEALSAEWVGADQLVVHPNQVVGRFGELRAVQVGGTWRDILLFCAPQPANLELECLAAFRASVGSPLRFSRFGVKISLIHSL